MLTPRVKPLVYCVQYSRRWRNTSAYNMHCTQVFPFWPHGRCFTFCFPRRDLDHLSTHGYARNDDELPVALASQAIRPALPAVILKETPRKVAPGKHAWLLPSCALNKSATLTGIPAKLESRRKPAPLWRTCANLQQRCLAA